MDAPDPSHLDDPVLVLNRAWLPVHVAPVRRAIAMMFRGVANAIDTDELSTHDFVDWLAVAPDKGRSIRTPSRPIAVPEVVQLLRYDKIPIFEVPFTRAGVFRRDESQCQYCGAKRPASLTIDHIVPRSRGGSTNWLNCVVACVRCNSKKGDRELGRSGVRLRRPPRAPRWTPAFDLHPGDVPESWSKFMLTKRRAAAGS